MTQASISRLAVVALCIALFATAAGGAHAQSYPAKPIRFILPQAPAEAPTP